MWCTSCTRLGFELMSLVADRFASSRGTEHEERFHLQDSRFDFPDVGSLTGSVDPIIISILRKEQVVMTTRAAGPQQAPMIMRVAARAWRIVAFPHLAGFYVCRGGGILRDAALASFLVNQGLGHGNRR